ncbi:MAG: VOC family protein [Gammaproteobacteria bacterium]|nr:VOC family protein [Gammaproteobacteria bacterium]
MPMVGRTGVSFRKFRFGAGRFGRFGNASQADASLRSHRATDARIDAPKSAPRLEQMKGALRKRCALLWLACLAGPIALASEQAATQEASPKLNVQTRVHFNINVSDFESARSFYGALGFATLSGFPDANTQAMARALGIATPTEYDGAQGGEAGGYLLHGELIGLGGFSGGAIDLIEFTIPRNDSPPYEALNRLGMVRAVMHTTDLDSAHAHMVANGVRFLSEPVQRSDGRRFAVFTDLDGTFYELAEVEGDPNDAPAPHIVGLGPVHINVSDFERSRAWYEMLGYRMSVERPATDSAAVARALGFERPFRIREALMTHMEDGSQIELTQWLEPFDPRPPYPIPVNHMGIHRMAFATTDIEGDVALLRAQDVRFVSEITPCCSGPDSSSRIILFYDPDGTIMELVQLPWHLSAFMAITGFFADLF